MCEEALIKEYKNYLVIPKYPPIEKINVKSVIDNIHPSIKTFIMKNRGIKKITICVTDNTRSFPERRILPYILKGLEFNKIEKTNITILIATGLHRHLKEEELILKFGKGIVKNYRIIQNNPFDSVRLNKRLFINRLLIESDAILGTGIFEPHQYAGFSGGNKIFIIGCGGKQTIDFTHSLSMILRKGVRIGNINNNPFRDFIEESARILPPRWVINLVLGRENEIISYSMGEPEDVFSELYEWYLKNLRFDFSFKYDGALIDIGDRKGVNLYQASRGATYIALSESPIIKKNAPIIVRARLEEGIGKGEGEREFARILCSSLKNHTLIKRLSSNGISGGGQRAAMLLFTLKEHPVIFTGYNKSCHIRRENLHFIRDTRLALDRVISEFGCKKVVYIKNPFYGLYCFSERKYGSR